MRLQYFYLLYVFDIWMQNMVSWILPLNPCFCASGCRRILGGLQLGVQCPHEAGDVPGCHRACVTCHTCHQTPTGRSWPPCLYRVGSRCGWVWLIKQRIDPSSWQILEDPGSANRTRSKLSSEVEMTHIHKHKCNVELPVNHCVHKRLWKFVWTHAGV